MTYIDRITEQIRAKCDRILEGSLTIQGFEILNVEDDGDPEGGVNAVVRFFLGGDFSDWASEPNLVEWATRTIKGKMQFYADSGDREVVYEPEDDTLVVRFAFLPNLDQAEYVAIALGVLEQFEGNREWPGYKDEVIGIRFDHDYLETTRLANNNPTTMVKGRGTGESCGCRVIGALGHGPPCSCGRRA